MRRPVDSGLSGVLKLALGLVWAVAPASAQSAPADMLIEPALYPVVGAPFMATVEWTSTEIGGDGTAVHHRRVSRVFRDSAGRQRFEDGQDEASPQPGMLPGVRLYDPLTHIFARLDQTRGIAEISPMGRTSAGALAVPASRTRGDVAADANTTAEEVKLPDGVTREPLPAREIAGFHAEGLRTTTRAATVDGKTVTVVDEVWESPAWRMPLLHIHDDPRGGHSEAQVTELTRGEPEAALFHPPAGYAVHDWQLATGRRVVLPKPSPLPQPILDDNLAAAADRMDTAATAHAATLTPVHLRFDLSMVDFKGGKHPATLETWRSEDGYRYELHSDAYNEVRVSDFRSGRQWESKEGLEPLRVAEFLRNEIKPIDEEYRLLHSGGTVPKLKPETVNGVALTCAGDSGTAVICFDQATGFLISAAIETEGVVYRGWQKVGWRYVPGTLLLVHDKKVLLEAKLAVASSEFPVSVFHEVDGLRETALMQSAGGPAPAPYAPQHRMLKRGVSTKAKGDWGGAQVRVWVDEKGKVTRAEVEDADDEEVAAWAVESALKSAYMPEKQNGQPAGFETTIFTLAQVRAMTVPAPVARVYVPGPPDPAAVVPLGPRH